MFEIDLSVVSYDCHSSIKKNLDIIDFRDFAFSTYMYIFT